MPFAIVNCTAYSYAPFWIILCTHAIKCDKYALPNSATWLFSHTHMNLSSCQSENLSQLEQSQSHI